MKGSLIEEKKDEEVFDWKETYFLVFEEKFYGKN
jgi:hypothetical protein